MENKMKKTEKSKYGHVGRPTNEEIKQYERKKTFKIIGITFIVLLIFGGVFLFFNKDKISLSSIMGNSTANFTMVQVQRTSKYSRITFKPDSYKSGYYYQNSIYVGGKKKKFISYIFNKAGCSSDKYKCEKIEVYSDGIQVGSFSTKSKYLKISEKYVGNNLALRISVKNRNTKKIEYKFLRLYITSSFGAKNGCYFAVNSANSNSIATSFWWPIAPDNNGIPQTKRITSKFSNVHKGIDIAGNSSSVIATYNGIVEKVVKNVKKNTSSTKEPNNGNYVVIKHLYRGEVYYSTYSHLKYKSIPSNIKKGNTITAGTKIGVMGNTGYAFGVHLHFSLRKDKNSLNNVVNPMNYINTSNPYPGSKWAC